MNQKKKEEVRGTFEFLKDWGDALTRWTERWIPDALVIVIGLSIVTFILALIWGFKSEIALGSRAYQSIQAWGKGFWELLAFTMQMCLIMMTGYILACSPPVRKLMDWIAGWSNPEKPWQAIVTMSLFSMIVAWFNWGTSLIASAMLALFIVRRNPKVDYRLLVAAAYLGLGCTWHSGLSGSSPLLVATPDNFVIKAKLLDAVIPIRETIFHPFNLGLTIIIMVVVTILMALMHPRPEKAFVVKPQLMDQLKLYEAPPKPARFESPSDWMNWWPGFNILLFIGGLVWLIWYFTIRHQHTVTHQRIRRQHQDSILVYAMTAYRSEHIRDGADVTEADKLMKIEEVAELTRLSVPTLRFLRHKGEGPRGFRLSKRLVYKRSDVLAWIDQQYEADKDTREAS